MVAGLTSRFLGGASAMVLSAMLAMPAAAQNRPAGNEEPIELDPVYVTGEKIRRSLDETASSVSVLTDKDLAEKTGENSLSEALNDVPNLVPIGTTGAPSIRGQDTQGPNAGSIAFLSGTVPRASVNVDGHYLSFYEYLYGGTSIWDVDSVEVFRGPQTTSQGANAIAGAILVRTKDPTFKPEAAYQMEYGSYDTRRGSFMLSGPLSQDFAARIAVDYWGRDTFIDYISPRFAKGKTDQSFDELNLRAKLLWQPQAIPGLKAKLTLAHTDTNRPTLEAAFLPYDDLKSGTLQMPSFRQRTNTAIFDLEYDFQNGMKLSNQTQYSQSRYDRFGVPRPNGSSDIAQKNVSNELKLNFGEEKDVWHGVVGLYYAHTKSDETLTLLNRQQQPGLSSFDDTKDNVGVFAEVNRRFGERWLLTGGLRYEHDSVKRNGFTSLTAVPLDYDKSFGALLPKLSLAYKLTDKITVGALVSRGFNPGGVSINLVPLPGEDPWKRFKAEKVWNYELFTRAHFLDDRLFVTGNLFYNDFKDAQRYVSVYLPQNNLTQLYTVNAEKAHAYGAEFGFDYRILDNVRLKAGFGALVSNIDKITSEPKYQGNEFQKAPGYMLSLGVSWDVTPKLNVSADLRHLDGYYSDDANSANLSIKPYTIADARVSYQLSEHAQIYGYVKNIFDERAATFRQINRSTATATPVVEAAMTAPRMIGIGLRGTF
ncbi:iron ABC transporter substrate-binding protein [Labrys sp. WJW]|uniref:TonB-dependent receptor n=1 Tax=Labrys sp. WJW TaxID=1737983 RepID=UPI000830C5E0|nr:iron ABC transporter substrate-binding protein [Labrys sp. WJW]